MKRRRQWEITDYSGEESYSCIIEGYALRVIDENTISVDGVRITFLSSLFNVEEVIDEDS